MIKMVQDEIRKGPWTEQEDILLMNFVGLFGDRRWDFIAKVSGLNRTGKSCRLRWVNYLHPGLKRGKMTPQEERLVLELHAKWGNRWSRIARKLPGRTDNEIKNYWRTHMRKKAQERKRSAAASASSPPSSSFSTCSPSSSTVTTVDGPATGKASFYDTGGHDHDVLMAAAALAGKKSGGHDYDDHQQVGEETYETGTYSMDDIWKDIEMSEENNENSIIKPLVCEDQSCNTFSCPSMASPPWDYFCLDSLLKMDHEDHQEESKMNILPNFDQFVTSYGYGID